jgi:hypothetical protein
MRWASPFSRCRLRTTVLIVGRQPLLPIPMGAAERQAGEPFGAYADVPAMIPRSSGIGSMFAAVLA